MMLIIVALLLSILLSAFQYLYKRKALLLFALRSLMYFAIMLLLINPKFEKQTEKIIKPKLYVLGDNTASIKKLNVDNQEVSLLNNIKNSKLSEIYDLQYFAFDSTLHPLDTLQWQSGNTDIAKVLQDLKDLHTTEHPAPVILLSDGISSVGKDYTYSVHSQDFLQYYPVLVGDTTRYQDVQINMLNVNPFAYKGDKFPVELFVDFSGTTPVRTQLLITEKGHTIFQKKLDFSPSHTSQKIETLLPASTKGTHHYRVRVHPLKDEINTLNNQKYFAVNVIDNAKKVLILAGLIHPDLGAIKASLSKNKYIQVSIEEPGKFKGNLKAFNTVILYQPTTDFTEIFNKIKKQKIPWLLITGKHTDWQFINRQNLFFSKQSGGSFESYYPIVNDNFSLFKLPQLHTENLPAVQDKYGKISLQATAETAIYAGIKGIKTNEPVLAFNTVEKQAAFFGQGIWRWRLQSGIAQERDKFDLLLQQSLQYLSLQQDYDRLKLHYKPQYYQADRIEITAQFLNKNLEPNDKAHALFYIKSDKGTEKIPMSQQDGFYSVDVSNLSPGTYSFSVSNANKTLSKSGSFVILPFSIEDKNLRADVEKLQLIANKTSGKIYFSNQINDLINSLQKNNKYPSISKITTVKTPLIDYKYQGEFFY